MGIKKKCRDKINLPISFFPLHLTIINRSVNKTHVVKSAMYL